MDNATAEYSFVTAFFTYDATIPTSDSIISPPAFLSPDQGIFTEQQSMVGSDYGGQRVRSAGMTSANGLSADTIQKEAQATIDALWKQIMSPVLGYCEVCLHPHL
jgi:vacuolar protein sorting-associated protein 52